MVIVYQDNLTAYMRIILFLILTFSSVLTFSQASKQLINGDMVIDGNKRSFLTYIPATDKAGKMPLVISLHGGFASPKGMFHLADFRPMADRDKFIVVCPASKHIWHDGADLHGIDDVKFIDQLITYIVKTYNADPDRVYVTGISNGGFMTARLACQLNQRIAAVAIVAASLDVGEGYDLQRPMPALYIHGTTDPIVAYNGGKLFGRRVFSHQDIISKWVELDKCEKEPIVTDIPDTARDGTSILKEEYRNPENGLKVISYSVVNGGHTWPGGWQYLPQFIVGKTTRNLNACEVIWDFFKPYKLSH
ncbi:prolyl oligopeptidase family serine peptidase [Mucilaginibacter corticis]|uniref:Prolyl oligopeptidase family serine peptidase n=2 Tax=Mucilaginibacter corticis TaxID=2597670 RepID=A0A556MHQ3_9SPHI|nr:prolyl oligopeptidase family serine peptidase [Mucilaginibacter corticis]